MPNGYSPVGRIVRVQTTPNDFVLQEINDINCTFVETGLSPIKNKEVPKEVKTLEEIQERLLEVTKVSFSARKRTLSAVLGIAERYSEIGVEHESGSVSLIGQRRLLGGCVDEIMPCLNLSDKRDLDIIWGDS